MRAHQHIFKYGAEHLEVHQGGNTFQGIAHLGECFHGELLLKQACGILSVCPFLRLIGNTNVRLYLKLRNQLVDF